MTKTDTRSKLGLDQGNYRFQLYELTVMVSKNCCKKLHSDDQTVYIPANKMAALQDTSKFNDLFI